MVLWYQNNHCSESSFTLVSSLLFSVGGIWYGIIVGF